MIYTFIFLLIATVFFLLKIEKTPKYHADKAEEERYKKEVSIHSEIDKKVNTVHKYYIDTFIGDRIKDEEWMRNNNAKPGAEVPAWRKYQIVSNPETPDGKSFKSRISSFDFRYKQLKDNTHYNNRIGVFSNLLNEIEDLFPEAFVAIKRSKKLKDLGI